MVFRITLALLLMAGSTSSAWAQMPPPPPPPGFRITHDGQDLTVAYQRWGMWIESQKGAVAEQALARPELIEAGWYAHPIMTAAFHNDFGRFASAEVRSNCRSPASGCGFLYRRADVPLSQSYGVSPNALDVWLRENFDPALVLHNLRDTAGGISGANLWRVRADVMFAGAASPQALLNENVRVLQIRSRDCPAFLTALQAIEGQRVEGPLDVPGIGEDRPIPPPRPHATRVFYTLSASVDGEQLDLSGGRALATLLQPVLDAVHECEQASASASAAATP
jgi:hypothetical protein